MNNRWTRGDVVAALVCVFAGVSISALPYCVEWFKTGQPLWLADHDELDLYLVIASHAYHRHATYLTDPNCAGSASYLPWLLIVPGIVVAKLMELPPIYIAMVWRVLGGAGIGFAWYLIFQSYFGNKLAALMLGLLALCDSGVFDGRPLLAHAVEVIRVNALSTDTLLPHDSLPRVSELCRLITPALSWPFLLTYIWLIGRAVRNPSQSSAALAGLGLGLCFSYFYYWTAALGGLWVATILDRGLWRTYLFVGLIGVAIGVPFLVAGLHLTGAGNPDWLERTDHFLPIRHFDELLIPKVAIGLIIITLPWVLSRERDLIFLWSLCASALILGNHQVVTGFQFENWHWHYVWGPTLWLLVILIAGRLYQRIPAFPSIAVPAAECVLAFTIATAFWMRSVETTRSLEAVTLTDGYRAFAPEFQRVSREFQSGAVVAGDPSMVSLLSIANDNRPLWNYSLVMSSCVDNKEWNQRVAANAYYAGLDRNAFERQQQQILDSNQWGPWARSSSARDSVMAERLSDFDAIAANPQASANRYHVEYVILPAEAADGHLNNQWSQIVAGPSWRAWRRELGESR